MGYHLAAVTMSILRGASKGERETSMPIFPGSGIFTSHEALNLPLETAMTRYRYNTSAHMVWLGERTKFLNGAHVEYVRGVRNPVGVKIGPNTSPTECVELLWKINPQKAVGKVALITRLGSHNVEHKLPTLIKAVRESGHVPVWLCDPCHGNTVTTPSKVKTRILDEMIAEVKASHMVHLEQASNLGGLHIEQTGENVTECVECDRTSLDSAEFPEYRTLCDPRLSGTQARKFIALYVDFVRKLAARNEESKSAGQPVRSSASSEEQKLYYDDIIQKVNDAGKVLAQEGLGSSLKVRA